jgi:hypothetical protein
VPIPDFMTCPHVVECRGRLLMVGGFGRWFLNLLRIN